MPSPTAKTKACYAGFSLIELMAVLVVVGLALGMIAVSIGHGGPEKQLYDKLDAFLTQSQFASDQAALSGDAFGLLVEPPQWQKEKNPEIDLQETGWRVTWKKLGQRGWEPVVGLDAIELPENILLEISLSNKRWDWSKAIDKVTPIIAVNPTGEISPFVIAIHFEQGREALAHVEVNKEGEIVWREAYEDEKKRAEKK